MYFSNTVLFLALKKEEMEFKILGNSNDIFILLLLVVNLGLTSYPDCQTIHFLFYHRQSSSTNMCWYV